MRKRRFGVRGQELVAGLDSDDTIEELEDEVSTVLLQIPVEAIFVVLLVVVVDIVWRSDLHRSKKISQKFFLNLLKSEFWVEMDEFLGKMEGTLLVVVVIPRVQLTPIPLICEAEQWNSSKKN